MSDIHDKIESILLKADKPSRYCGSEFNTPAMKKDAPLQFLMCFPDVYEVAHSNLGIKILYGILNSRSDTCCQTAYAPWQDMAGLMRQNDIPLFSLEERKSAREFNMIGFSLQYELSYTNILYMLELARIPLKTSARAESDPIIIGGGPCAINPMPLGDFFDLFCIGDGENVIETLADIYIQNKKSGGKKADFLKEAAEIDGIFVPSLNQKQVRRAVINDLDKAFFPTKIQIPNTEAVHNRAVLEIFRGCTRGCRFCQAGMIYRPVRERNVDTLISHAKNLIENNGFDEISFSSLSTCDYPHLRELLQKIKPLTDKARVNISLPSTRVDSFEADYTENLRKSSITFAPEAGTQRLRDVINKNVTENDILSSCGTAFEKGYSSIKLYFMIGLPTETQEDIDGIIGLAAKIRRLYKERASTKKPLALSVSTSVFIPKPFTPFQWEARLDTETVIKTQMHLKESLKKLSVKYSWHDVKCSEIETAMARGGRELGAVILSAYESGCIFDSWSELFDFTKWTDAFEKNGLSTGSYTKGIDINAQLPWDNINAGITKDFLKKEREKAYSAVCTPDCRDKCVSCGMNSFLKNGCKAKTAGGIK